MRNISKAPKDLTRGRLKAIIAEHGETQLELARAIGVKPQTLSMAINGRANFAHATMLKIAKWYRLTPDEFMYVFFPEYIAELYNE